MTPLTFAFIEENYTFLENLVDLCHGFFCDRERYLEFYKHWGQTLNGFPGVHQYFLEVALEFTNWEITNNIEWDGEWLDVTSDLATEVFRYGTEEGELLKGEPLTAFLTKALAARRAGTKPSDNGPTQSALPENPPPAG